jgi:HPt (histidine-containing phosphotransfer) domain-containing protein
MTTLVDFDRLQSFTDGDRQLEAELATLFLATAEGYLAELALALDDVAAWRATAHNLKGAAGNIGAVALAELAATAERTLPDPARLQTLRATLATTRGALEHHHLDSTTDPNRRVPPLRPDAPRADLSA